MNIVPCNTSNEAMVLMHKSLEASYNLGSDRNTPDAQRRADHERLQRQAGVYRRIAETLRREGK